MNDLQIFNSSEFGRIRTLDKNGQPYFVASDIAKALGYIDSAKAIRTHCKGVSEMSTPTNGGIQTVKIIPEGDVYRLIMKSKLPSAERFESWVMDEVLPTIRKHGMYAVDELVNNPDLLIKVATELKQEREQNAKLTKKIEDDRPFVEFATYISESADTIDMSEMGKIINSDIKPMGRNRLITLLKDNGVLMDNNLPYQKYVDNGYFEVAECPKNTVSGSRVFLKTVITGKGQMWLIDKFRRGVL
jgi:anti-repressor protein